MKSLHEDLKSGFNECNAAVEEMRKLKKELSGGEQEKRCVNCHKCYHPRLNTATSCVYHPGKVMFYSCKYKTQTKKIIGRAGRTRTMCAACCATTARPGALSRSMPLKVLNECDRVYCRVEQRIMRYY